MENCFFFCFHSLGIGSSQNQSKRSLHWTKINTFSLVYSKYLFSFLICFFEKIFKTKTQWKTLSLEKSAKISSYHLIFPLIVKEKKTDPKKMTLFLVGVGFFFETTRKVGWSVFDPSSWLKHPADTNTFKFGEIIEGFPS